MRLSDKGLERLKLDEGWSGFAYKDTKGVTTIGFGRNLDHVGITKEEGELLLANDISKVERAIELQYPWALELDEVRYAVVFNMCYNLGVAKFKSFIRTINAIQAKDYARAAHCMLWNEKGQPSLWSLQVKHRATRLATMMRTGQFIDRSLNRTGV